MCKKRKRHIPKGVWRIEGEAKIGLRRVNIESLVDVGDQHISAYTRAQATKLFADRFKELFSNSVYLGNCEVYEIKTWPATEKEVHSASEQLDLF